jgi:hypothetical protein
MSLLKELSGECLEHVDMAWERRTDESKVQGSVRMRGFFNNFSSFEA